MSGDVPERQVARAARLLAQTGAYLEAEAAGYALRTSADRRRRPAMRLDEALFRALATAPGLKRRSGGGWVALHRADLTDAPQPGRPGVYEGERLVAEPDGRLMRRRANLGESPLAWLARRRDAEGQPWLSPQELMAAERLRDDVQTCGLIGRLTMDWSARPRASGGRGPGAEPAERAQAAKARVRAALKAVGPDLAPMLERICLVGSPMEAAERDLGLARRTGKRVLIQALRRLAAHYGMM